MFSLMLLSFNFESSRNDCYLHIVLMIRRTGPVYKILGGTIASPAPKVIAFVFERMA